MTATEPITGRDRHLLILDTPSLWPAWPFLPLVRRTSGTDEFGLLYDRTDAAHEVPTLGPRPTKVVLANLFQLPATEAEFLAWPHEEYESQAAVYSAGWRVD